MQHFVLYLNLWGTTAKHLDGEDEGFSSDQIVVCQTRFTRVLAELARFHPSVSVVQAADYAYAASSDLECLVRFAVSAFQEMTKSEGEFAFWPLRGAIAAGACELDVTGAGPSNFVSWMRGGEGTVLAGYIEKSAQKGSRLFLDEASVTVLDSSDRSGSYRLRASSARGRAHHEVNWMTPEYLNAKVGARSNEEHLRDAIGRLFEGGTNYGQRMASSLADLIAWTRDGHVA